MEKPPSFGIDSLLQDQKLLNRLSKQRVGFLTNKKTLTREGVPSAYAVHEKIGCALKCILTPEHGWSGVIAEGVGVADGVESQTGVPLLSLYGESRIRDFMISQPLDVLLIELQDIGLRCYTYAATCAKLMEAFVDTPFEVIVCDRPNPLGPQQQGTTFDPAWRSILSYIDVPFQHGQTMGGLLSGFNETLGKKKLPLAVLPCQPFHKPHAYPWQPPSPNLPSWESVLLYPALVMLEGVNVSEGRGTALPFTSLGAPGLDHKGLADFINPLYPGVQAHPLTFTPQSSTCEGQDCQGIRFALEKEAEFNALALGKQILRFLRGNYVDFEWIPLFSSPGEPAKEGRYFIDALMGTSSFRQEIDQEKSSPE